MADKNDYLVGGYVFFGEEKSHLWAYGPHARIDKTACGRTAVHDMMRTGAILVALDVNDEKTCAACRAAWSAGRDAATKK